MTVMATSLNSLASGGEVSIRASQSSIPSFESFAMQFEDASRNGEKETLRDAAEQLVSSSFILPILSMIRESSNGEGPFAPGTAERRFGPLFDQHIADSITKAANFPLVDAIVDRYLPRTALSLPEGTEMMKEPVDA